MMVLRPPVKHSFNKRKIVLMSGLSNPNSCRLSQLQRSFLDKLNATSNEVVQSNFPYLVDESGETPPPSLLTASINNGKQFLTARRSPYKESAIAHWQSLVDSCNELIVITLSCGLEIFNVCTSTGIQPDRMHVIALGPVARNRPDAPHQLIRGGWDFVTLPFFPTADMIIPRVGHMNYLENETVLEIVNQTLT